MYTFSPQKINLPEPVFLFITQEDLSGATSTVIVSDGYIFIPGVVGSTTITTPKVGDMRISYRVVKPDFIGTVFGRLSGDMVDEYITTKNTTLYRLFSGTREEGIKYLHTEYIFLKWLFRLVGLILMYKALVRILEPVNALLGYIPLIGSTSRGVIKFSCFIISFILSSITIIISIIFHNIIVLLILVSGIIFTTFSIYKKHKNGIESQSSGDRETMQPLVTTVNPPITPMQ